MIWNGVYRSSRYLIKLGYGRMLRSLKLAVLVVVGSSGWVSVSSLQVASQEVNTKARVVYEMSCRSQRRQATSWGKGSASSK